MAITSIMLGASPEAADAAAAAAACREHSHVVICSTGRSTGNSSASPATGGVKLSTGSEPASEPACAGCGALTTRRLHNTLFRCSFRDLCGAATHRGESLRPWPERQEQAWAQPATVLLKPSAKFCRSRSWGIDRTQGAGVLTGRPKVGDLGSRDQFGPSSQPLQVVKTSLTHSRRAQIQP